MVTRKTEGNPFSVPPQEQLNQELLVTAKKIAPVASKDKTIDQIKLEAKPLFRQFFKPFLLLRGCYVASLVCHGYSYDEAVTLVKSDFNAVQGLYDDEGRFNTNKTEPRRRQVLRRNLLSAHQRLERQAGKKVDEQGALNLLVQSLMDQSGTGKARTTFEARVRRVMTIHNCSREVAEKIVQSQEAKEKAQKEAAAQESNPLDSLLRDLHKTNIQIERALREMKAKQAESKPTEIKAELATSPYAHLTEEELQKRSPEFQELVRQIRDLEEKKDRILAEEVEKQREESEYQKVRDEIDYIKIIFEAFDKSILENRYSRERLLELGKKAQNLDGRFPASVSATIVALDYINELRVATVTREIYVEYLTTAVFHETVLDDFDLGSVKEKDRDAFMRSVINVAGDLFENESKKSLAQIFKEAFVKRMVSYRTSISR